MGKASQGVGVFRTVNEFLALTGEDRPTPAELRLVKAVRAGTDCVISKERPEAGTPENTVRAGLLRLLIVGATPECGTQDFGVWLEGGWIAGVLDLQFAQARVRTVLDACRFVERPMLNESDLNELSLDGSHLPGLFAQGVRVRGNLYLRDVTAKGTVDVSGAKVGGKLDCEGATLDGAGGKALNAQGVETGSSLFMSDVTATGTVDVAGAKVGGQLNCDGAKLDGAGGKALNAQGVETGLSLILSRVMATGTVDVIGAKVGGQFDCDRATLDGAGGYALNAQRLHVVQGLIWREVTVTVTAGAVVMLAAQAGDLVDDGCWPGEVDELVLDGFTYDRIAGDRAPVTAAGRRGWLRVGSVWKGRFTPQPYTQLARVFRGMGLGGEARTVLFWREREVFAQAQRDLLSAPVGPDDMAFGHLWREVRARLLGFGGAALRIVAGYGYKPFRAFWCLCGLWFAAFLMASAVWEEGSFAPNSDVVLVSAGWQTALAADCFKPLPTGAQGVCDPNPANTWSSDPARGMDWESFSAMGWAADLVVPILDLGQTDAWAPSKDRGTWV